MKKLITKYWGLVLAVVLISSLFVGAVPVSAADYAVTASATPSAINGLLAPAAGFGINDVAASGSTIYAVASDAAAADYLYKSVDGGATWSALGLGAGLPAAGAGDTWGKVAVAPDDPNIVCVVDTTAAPNVVYYSSNGGILFNTLGVFATGLAIVNDVTISPLSGVNRYIVAGGSSAAAAAGTACLEVINMGAFNRAWANLGTAAGAFTPTAGAEVPSTVSANSLDDVEAVEFSPSFLADQSLLFITETVGTAGLDGEVALHVYSFNTNTYDAAVDISFPRVLELTTTAVLTTDRAQLVLDPNFYLGDEATQIGFIGANIFDGAAAVGGVYRVGTYTVAGGVYTMSQIMQATDIYSVAWDGTNLMATQFTVTGAAAVTTGLITWRSSTALSAAPVFQQSSTVKTMGTGLFPQVLFNGGVGYGFSQGANAAIAKTTDFGKSFNGVALVASDFTDIIDFWVSPDAARMYALTNDTVDTNLWRKTGATWERVMILATEVVGDWLVRADADTPDTVYLGRKAGTNLWKSLDAGEFVWTPRSTLGAIADFEVQDANILYNLTAAGAVNKSTNGAFTWTPGAATTLASGYDLALIADDSILVGSAGGTVAYSTDGAATFTALTVLPPGLALPATNTTVTATGLAAGDMIFAGSATAAGAVGIWVIGTSTGWALDPAVDATGVGYANGVLYAFDDTANTLNRYLAPSALTAAPTDAVAFAGVVDQTNIVNSVQITANNTVWVRDAVAAAADTINSFSDPLAVTTAVPTGTYPIDATIIPVNSLTGVPNPFNFQFTAPAVSTPVGGFNFNLIVYLDEDGTIPVAGDLAAGGVLAANAFAPTVVVSDTFPAGGGTAFAGIPGTTYWWRVRTDAGNPLQSYWSEMYSFSVQALTAVVPVIASPENGTVINAGMAPAFSWSPITGAATYAFEVSTEPTFATTVYSTTTASAGASLPSSVALEAGTNYFWRVRAITPTEGEWSTVANFSIAEEAAPTSTAPVVTPTITVELPTPTVTTVVVTQPAPPAEEVVNPSYIWAIIIIGAVLVIAVIVLIVRTRRSV